MEFEVNFGCRACKYVMCFKEKNNVGLNEVDEIREFTGVKNLNIGKIIGIVGSYQKYCYTIILTEKTARRTGLFNTHHNITVYVPEGALEFYLERKISVVKSETTGEIEKVLFYWEMDKDQLLRNWETEGFPLEWNKGT